MILAELTKHAKIYKKSYWGNFVEHEYKSIISARNWFILKYKIVSYKKCPTQLINLRRELDLDHTETYEDIQGRIIYLYSMYKKRNIPNFTTIYSMYARGQRTAIQIFETTKSKKMMIKKIKERLPDELNNIIKNYLNGDKWYKIY
jgi:hypothetical protein